MVTVRELTAKVDVEGNVGDKLAKFGLVIGGLKEALGLLTGAFDLAKAALFDFTADIATAGDELAKASRRAGISVESFQELKFAAEIAGASTRDVEVGMQRLAKSLSDATLRGTGPFADQLNALGIGIEEFDGLEPDQAFERVADIVQQLPTEMEKLAFAQDALGRGGKRLLPILNDGAAGIRALREESRELGILTNEDALASEEFADAQLRLDQTLQGLKFTIGAELIPFVQQIIDEIRNWVTENRDLIAVDVAGFIRELLVELKELGPTILAGAEALAELLRFTVEVIKEGQSLVMLLQQWNEDTGILTTAWDGLVEAVKASIRPFTLTADAIERVAVAVGLLEEKGEEGEKKQVKRGLAGVDLSPSQQRAANRARIRAGTQAAATVLTNSLIVASGQAAVDAARKSISSGRRQTLTRNLRRSRGGGGRRAQAAESKQATDEDLLRLISAVPGADIEGARQRLLPGAPPVIAVQVTNNEINLDAPISVEVNGVPGTSAEEVGQIAAERSADMFREQLDQAIEVLQPVQAR